MNVDSILLKLKLRINKLDSQDYDNLEIWQLLEAYNRSQLLYVRKNLHGNNIYKEGDEASKRRMDDFNRLLVTKSIGFHKDSYTDFIVTDPIFDDYMMFKSIVAKVSCSCCEDELMNIHLVKAANKFVFSGNSMYNCNFDYRETFAVSEGNRFSIDLRCVDKVEDISLTYYRYPVNIEKAGHVNVMTGAVSVADVGSEFTDDTTEAIIEFTASMIGSDIMDGDIYQMRSNNEQNMN